MMNQRVGRADFLAPLPLASRIEGLLLPGTRNAGGSATLALRPRKDNRSLSALTSLTSASEALTGVTGEQASFI